MASRPRPPGTRQQSLQAAERNVPHPCTRNRTPQSCRRHPECYPKTFVGQFVCSARPGVEKAMAGIYDSASFDSVSRSPSRSRLRRAERKAGVPHPCTTYDPETCRRHPECNLVTGTRLCRANPGVEEQIARRTLRTRGPAHHHARGAFQSPMRHRRTHTDGQWQSPRYGRSSW